MIIYTICVLIGLVALFFTKMHEEDIRTSMAANQANWQIVSQSQINLDEKIRASQRASEKTKSQRASEKIR